MALLHFYLQGSRRCKWSNNEVCVGAWKIAAGVFDKETRIKKVCQVSLLAAALSCQLTQKCEVWQKKCYRHNTNWQQHMMSRDFETTLLWQFHPRHPWLLGKQPRPSWSEKCVSFCLLWICFGCCHCGAVNVSVRGFMAMWPAETAVEAPFLHCLAWCWTEQNLVPVVCCWLFFWLLFGLDMVPVAPMSCLFFFTFYRANDSLWSFLLLYPSEVLIIWSSLIRPFGEDHHTSQIAWLWHMHYIILYHIVNKTDINSSYVPNNTLY